jgi:uncharacterized protein
MIDPIIKSKILQKLAAAEAEHEVKIVLAVESGSRAWGFASPNSDYDARFIYVHKPEWYLSVGLEEQRDVIEYPIVDELDINGWDVRKALRLFWKSNPAFIEWLQSPIIYRQHTAFKAGAVDLLEGVYSVASGIYHYRSMAKTNFKTHLRGDTALQSEPVPAKKYFYVLRALLSVRWLESYKTPAPVEFSQLLHLVADNLPLTDAIDKLLEKKRSSDELGLAAPIPVLHEFIVQELTRLERVTPTSVVRNNVEPQLTQLFRAVLQEAWL